MLITYFVSFVFIALASKQIGKFFSQINLPYITGYLLAGMVAGPFILELLPEGAAADLRFIDELSLAVIAFVAGSELYLKEMQGRLKLIAFNALGIMIAASIFGGIAIFLLTAVMPFTEGMSTAGRVAVAILGSTILLALSPASTIAVIKEVRAQGPFTRTILGVTVAMDVIIIVFFAISASIASVLIADSAFDLSFILILAIDLIVAGFSGYAVGKILEFILANKIHTYIKIGLILFVGLSVFVIAFQLADFSKENLPIEIHIEPLLVCMIAGFFVTNYTDHRIEFADVLHDIGPTIYVAFFTLTGISLKLDILLETLPIAAALFTVRVFGIFVGSYSASTLLGEAPRFRQISWMGFITQAGIALGLAREVAIEFPLLGNEFATMIISVVVLNEIFGPMFLKSALKRAGETHLPEAHQPDEVRDALILGVEGQSLALGRQLQANNWKVIIADTNAEHVERLRDETLDERHIPEISVDCLQQIISNRTDALVAMMDDDDDNLKACEIAYEKFGIQRIVVRLNDLANSEKFEELGAYVVDTATAMVNLIDQSVRTPQSAALLTQRDPEYQISQVTVTNPDIHNKLLRDLRLANDVLILGISRNGHSIVPHGYTAVHLEDEVTLVGKPESLKEVTLKFGY